MNFYDSFIEGAQGSSPRERGDFYVAVLEYLYYDGRMPEFKLCKWADQAFTMIRPILDSQLAKQRAGSKGGRMRAINQAEGQASAQAEAKQTAKQKPSRTQASGQAEGQASAQAEANLTGTVTGTEIPSANAEGKKSAPRFVPPTADEVAEYAKAKGYEIDPEAFCAYYGSQGWRKANGQRVTNWKLAVVNWARGRYGGKGASQGGGERHAEYD